jgi:Kdo2-lipid IVA lauroyltransferase/acyltransferase
VFKGFLKYLAYRVGFWLLQGIPRRALYRIAAQVGFLCYGIYPEGRQAVHANLRHVLGEGAPEKYIEATAREIFRNAARYYADLAATPRLEIEHFYRHEIITHHFQNLKDAIEAGRGVILASGHYGSPEITAQFLRYFDIELFVLTEPMSPKRLSRFIDRVRGSQGHRFQTVSFAAMKEAFRTIRRGGLVALLYDRDVIGGGHPARFFGREALVPTGVADLALKTNALIVPSFVRRRPNGRFDVWIHPPMEAIRTGAPRRDRVATMEALLKILEGYIREDPRQWIVLESVWR